MSAAPGRVSPRIGTCLRNSETTKASTATGIAEAKTCCSVSAYAATTAACCAAGRFATAEGVVTWVGSAPVSAMAFARFGASWLAYKVPNTAAPKELPMVRKKVTPEVATPRSRYSTVFWTMIVSTCMDRPIPTPSTSIAPDVSSVVECWSRRDSPHIPTAITTEPTIGKMR